MPKFREITGQFVGYVPDGPDTNIVPDRAPMDGRVVFTPVFTGGVVAFPELVPPEFAHPEPIRAKIIDGFVRVEVAVGDDVLVQPLSLMVTVDDEASQVWSWRAEFTNMRINSGESEISIPSWSFRVPDGTGPVDLTELVPLKTSGTVDVTKGPRGAGLENITAVDGRLVFEYTDGEQATIAIPEAVQGPQGEPGPAGADGAQGPEGPQGPAGEIPDLLVSNISDATPTGKNLMLAATEGAARNALGLQTGATTIAGAYSELKPGSTQTNSRVWSPKNISDYVEERTEAAKVFVNVKDYGAVGDGVADDMNAIQAAINHIDNMGGGTLYFPPGRYWASSNVVLCPRLEVYGSSNTVLLKRPGMDARYAYFVTRSGEEQGYGSGADGIYVHDLTFEGDLSLGGACAFGLHHARNVVVERCNFVSMMRTGHIFDLTGCDKITIRDCGFYGFSPTTTGYYRAEAIQVDMSYSGSASTPDNPLSWDGLPTRDVLVDSCNFMPLTWKGVNYRAPNPIGSHSERQGAFHENITIQNCLIEDPYPDNESSATSGVIHFVGAKNINILNNRFVSKVGTLRTIGFYGAVNVTASDSPTHPDETTTTVSVPGGLGCHNISIKNNTFVGYEANLGNSGTCINFGSTNRSTDVINHTGIVIDGNHWEFGNGSLAATNTLEIRNCVNAVVANNTQTGPSRFVHMVGSNETSVTGNNITRARADAIRLDSAENVVVANNTSTTPAGTSVYIATCSGVTVTGNIIKGAQGGARDIAAVAVTRGSFTANVVAARTRGIEIYSSSANNIVVGNVLTGADEDGLLDNGVGTVKANNITS